MPMVATLNDEAIDSFSIDGPEWQALRASYRQQDLRMVCGGAAIPKTSSLGLRFFAHYPGQDCGLHQSGPESAEHQAAKRALADAAREAGWDAEVESIAPDRSWIADVLIQRNGLRVALEVQWSPQTVDEFERRSARYRASGVDCVWFVGPKNHKRDVPRSYAINGDASDLTVIVPGLLGRQDESLPLADGARRMFSGELATGADLRTTELEVGYFPLRCFVKQCNAWYSRWFLSGLVAESRCGQNVRVELIATQHGQLSTATGLTLPSAGHGDNDWGPIWGSFAQVRAEEKLQAAVIPLLSAEDIPAPCKYGRRRSKQVPEGYIAALCPRCGVMQGDAHLDGQEPRLRTLSLPWRTRMTLVPDHGLRRHWCPDVGNGRCAQPADTAFSFPLRHQEVIISATVRSTDANHDTLPP